MNALKKTAAFFSLIALGITTPLYAQRDNVWLFGDSLAIDFITGSPVVSSFNVSSYNNETHSNICDATGNLLFYMSAWPSVATYEYALMNASGNMVQGGDTFKIDASCSQGSLFIPHPADSSLYFLFYHYTPFYSQPPTAFRVALINKDSNNGNGEVIYKDSLLATGLFTEKLTAVKHGNGTDWWVLIHKGVSWQGPVTDGDCFYRFLLDSSGIHGPYQQCDSFYYSGYFGFAGQMVASPAGNKIACSLTGSDTTLVYNFDRCTGLLSNRIILKSYYYGSYSCCFSPSSEKIYLSIGQYIFQFDLQAPNIQLSKTTVHYLNIPLHGFHQILLGPDNKIYVSVVHGAQVPPATTYNTYLGVINNPEGAGTSCNFNISGVYLQGRIKRGGLPNMPHYNLGAIELPCVVNISEVANNNNREFTIYPNPASSILTLNHVLATEGESYIVNLYAADGRLVLQKQLSGVSSTLNISMLASGVYYATAQSGDTFFPAVKFTVTR